MGNGQRDKRHEIIGRGTWYDKTALELIERERRLGRSLDLIRTESGLGASGFPHIGSLGDALRNLAVAMGVKIQGYDAELIAFSDDKDGLRKVPAGLPEEMEKWLGYPVSSIPDDFGDCHESFGAHMSSLLLDALGTCGAEYRFMSGTKVYEEGILDDEIVTIMEKADKAGEIIKEELGQEKYTETLPYFAVCESCGRIYTTNAYRYIPGERKVLYRCEGMEVKGRWLEGCGHEGEVDVTSGMGKLSWKVEFAARWRALDIRFEAYGKDIADSVRVNDRICKEILGHEPPMHAQYEMFLDRGGKKISKSAGNVFTPQVWYRYASPQSLNLLIFKRFVGTKSGSVEDIQPHADELDDIEDIYFGRRKVKDSMEEAKLKGLYEYCWMMKPPQEPDIHVPYNLMINLAKVAPKAAEAGFIVEKLETYGYLKDNDRGLDKRIGYALNWVEDFGEAEVQRVELSEADVKAVSGVIEALKAAKHEDDYQASVFDVARTLEIRPESLFRILYKILIGRSQGPRFGPYVASMGKESVVRELEKAL
ncbi:MAG: lysine--tRNA ligase [Candidatus Bathyarchaeota archaeon]|nr:MAG: lysine--tRNA ligase [Candidatus Bathyarchaeota archaeon]